MNSNPLWLVTNSASGSNSEAAVRDVIAALSAAGCAPQRTIDFPKDDLPDCAALEHAGVATVAVFTGDGTVNAVATAIEGWGGALLVLPGGTQNLMCKRLHADRSACAIVAAFAKGQFERTRPTVLRTSQGTSLIEVLAGPGAMWADVREGVRDLDLATIAEAFSTAWRETTDGATIHLADTAAGKPRGYRAILLAPHGERVLAEGYDFEDAADFAAQGFAMLVKRNFREGPHDDLGEFGSVTCRSDAPIALMIDGERRQGACEERFESAQFALDFIATRQSGD